LADEKQRRIVEKGCTLIGGFDGRARLPFADFPRQNRLTHAMLEWQQDKKGRAYV
jgi:hypothetical protein